ncbi:MAG: ABC transporter ATP-binding protein [Rhodobacteraceae bacterium]|jgi:iron(III) transport system ATP-binding protein|nr:ABC transporter ATP-binding protein [Paracoccaceae bacterium]
MAEVIARNLSRRYGEYIAIEDVSFHVKDGEFLTLLGPSGCGKSTTLGILAGLDRPDEGHLSIGGEVFFDGLTGVFVDAERRNLGLVFQTYALWPHMTVRDNVGYALRIRRIPRAEREKRIREALALVEMEQFIDRYPSQLSGGQQQRVALARTLAYNPRILLLDEPLSNLDAKLRDKARSWLRQLQTQLGVTTIFVTHDQIEALALSDRIAVMNKGRIVQIGSPREIYEEPASTFVADFIGTTNLIRGQVSEIADGIATITLSDGQSLRAVARSDLVAGGVALVACRPERIEVATTDAAGQNVLRARLIERTYLGARVLYEFGAAGNSIKVETPCELPEEADLHLPVDHCIAFPATEASTG